MTPCGSLPEKHLLRKVDQRGGSGVDQGGSAVYHGHVLVPGLRKTLKNVGEPRMPQLPAAGRTCPFINFMQPRSSQRLECLSRLMIGTPIKYQGELVPSWVGQMAPGWLAGPVNSPRPPDVR